VHDSIPCVGINVAVTLCAVQDQYMFNELPDGVQAASAEDMEA